MAKNKEAARNSLKAEECIKIIKCCKESDVLDFEYHGLKIKFINTKEELPKEPIPMTINSRNPVKTKKEQEMEELDELLLSNPLEYETRLAELEQEELIP